jgi:hypothetical protein
MGVLGSAIGAILAAMLESSVLTHLQVGGLKPDLVFALGVAVAMVLGFDCGVTWAVVGGLSLDLLLPERALGATALLLLLVIGVALLVARMTWPPRLPVVAFTTFALAIGFQLATLAFLAFTSGVGFDGLSAASLAGAALLDAGVAVLAVVALRALELRFGDLDRAEW